MKRRPKNLLLLMFLVLLNFGGFFYWQNFCWAEEDKIIITEIMYNPEGSDTSREWLEIYNNSNQAISLLGWKFFEAGANHKLTLFKGTTALQSGEYAVIAENAENFLKEYVTFPGTLFDSSFSLNNDGETLALKNMDGNIVDQINYLKDMGGNGNGFSIEFRNDTWKQSYTSLGTPGLENSKEPEPAPEPAPEPTPEPTPDPAPESKIHSDKIQIAELFPSPADGEDEYIELYNNSDDEINLNGWSLHDASQSGEYIFTATDSIKSKEYLAIYKNISKLKLNNDAESVMLFDPDKKEIFKVSYNGSKKGVSYNFDGQNWRWSKFLTPSQENIFNNEPYGKVKIDDDIYVDVYADFSVSTDDADGEKVKVTWDFGDGHKSYLAKNRHKYEKEGKYAGTVKLSDGSEDVIENFTVEVEKFPRPKIRILSANANPKGKDDFESITLINKSKKEVNLKGWSIATGWKKLTNHPINLDFEIKAGQEKEITKAFSKFTLNNQKSKIELRYPDDKVAHDVKYKKDKVADDEIYAKIDSQWKWMIKKPTEKNPPENAEEDVIDIPIEILPEADPSIELEPQPAEIPENIIGKYSEIKNRKPDIEAKILGFRDSKINPASASRFAMIGQPFVLGASTARANNTTLPIQKSFSENLFWKINLFLNKLIYNFDK